MAEGASIDEQAHAMDSERWILEVLEFDRTIKRAQDFAAQRGNTLVIVTADHETVGASLIGASMVSDAQLGSLIRAQNAVKGVTAPADASGANKPGKPRKWSQEW